MYFKPQELVEFFQHSSVDEFVKRNYHHSLPWAQAGIDGGGVDVGWGVVEYPNLSSFDYASVDMGKLMEVVHERIAQGNMLEWKALRPWVVCDVTANLDPEQPWIGWEIETGWNTHEDRYAVVSLFNERYMYSCTDNEGHGSYPIELTFSPQTPAYYTSRGTPVHPLLFVANHKERADEHRPGNMVGTHINFSTPAFRAGDELLRRRVEGALNNSLVLLTGPQKKELFGRSELYAGCFLRGDNDSESGTGVCWIEGKLFNSTYDTAVAKGYIEVGNRMCAVMEQLAQLGGALGTVAVTNFYDMLSGAASEITTNVTGYLRDGDNVDSDNYGEYDEYDEDLLPGPPDDVWENDDGDAWCRECQAYH